MEQTKYKSTKVTLLQKRKIPLGSTKSSIVCKMWEAINDFSLLSTGEAQLDSHFQFWAIHSLPEESNRNYGKLRKNKERLKELGLFTPEKRLKFRLKLFLEMPPFKHYNR